MKTTEVEESNSIFDNYKIVKRTYLNGKIDYVVMEYTKKWYSRKYKWRIIQEWYGDEGGCYHTDAVFRSEAEAHSFLLGYINHIVKEEDIKPYIK